MAAPGTLEGIGRASVWLSRAGDRQYVAAGLRAGVRERSSQGLTPVPPGERSDPAYESRSHHYFEMR